MLNGPISNGSWRVVLADDAQKQIGRLPDAYRRMVLSVIDEMQARPFSGDVRRLHGNGAFWRRRVGSYRIIFEMHPAQRVVFIYEVARRASKTY